MHKHSDLIQAAIEGIKCPKELFGVAVDAFAKNGRLVEIVDCGVGVKPQLLGFVVGDAFEAENGVGVLHLVLIDVRLGYGEHIFHQLLVADGVAISASALNHVVIVILVAVAHSAAYFVTSDAEFVHGRVPSRGNGVVGILRELVLGADAGVKPPFVGVVDVARSGFGVIGGAPFGVFAVLHFNGVFLFFGPFVVVGDCVDESAKKFGGSTSLSQHAVVHKANERHHCAKSNCIVLEVLNVVVDITNYGEHQNDEYVGNGCHRWVRVKHPPAVLAGHARWLNVLNCDYLNKSMLSSVWVATASRVLVDEITSYSISLLLVMNQRDG